MKARAEIPWDDWEYVMITHTISGKHADEWCEILAEKAGIPLDEVDWSSYCGRHVIKTTPGNRASVTKAVRKKLDVLRVMFRAALKRLGMGDLSDIENQSIGRWLTEDGVLVDDNSFFFRLQKRTLWNRLTDNVIVNSVSKKMKIFLAVVAIIWMIFYAWLWWIFNETSTMLEDSAVSLKESNKILVGTSKKVDGISVMLDDSSKMLDDSSKMIEESSKTVDRMTIKVDNQTNQILDALDDAGKP